MYSAQSSVNQSPQAEAPVTHVLHPLMASLSQVRVPGDRGFLGKVYFSDNEDLFWYKQVAGLTTQTAFCREVFGGVYRVKLYVPLGSSRQIQGGSYEQLQKII